MPEENQKAESAGKIPTVDPNLCIGCGLCATTCGEVFELGDDGKSFVKDAAGCTAPAGGQAKCNCQEAIDGCPAHAISWTEEEKSQ